MGLLHTKSKSSQETVVLNWSDEERNLLRLCWKQAEPLMQEIGTETFLLLFFNSDEILRIFYPELRIEEVDVHAVEICHHSLRFLGALDRTVRYLHRKQDGKAVLNLRTLGQRHSKFGVKTLHLEEVNNPLLQAVEAQMKANSKWDEGYRPILRKFVGLVQRHMTYGLITAPQKSDTDELTKSSNDIIMSI